MDTISIMEKTIQTRKEEAAELGENGATLEEEAKEILLSLQKEHYWIERCEEKDLMNGLSKTVMRYYESIEDPSLKTDYGCLLLKIFFDLEMIKEIENVVYEIQSLAEETGNQELLLKIGNNYGLLLIEEDRESAKAIFFNLSEVAESIKYPIPETLELIGNIFKNLAITLVIEEPAQVETNLKIARKYYEAAGTFKKHEKQLAKI